MSKKIYVGTYTDHIYCFEFDNGQLLKQILTEKTPNPSYLITNEEWSILYAVNELNEYKGISGGGVSSFRINQETGNLTLINSQNTLGKDPCHLCIFENHLFVANYSEGTISQFQLNPDGSIGPLSEVYKHIGCGPDKSRQEAPHVHYVTPIENHLVSVDLGIDEVTYYKFINQKLIKDFNIKLTPGSGPRHLVYKKPYTYILNELSSSIVVLNHKEMIQTISTLPMDYKDFNNAGAIKLSPNEKYLYVSNRGHDSITVFKINQEDGTLMVVDYVSTNGSYPRDFSIIDGYLFVCNQKENTIVSFEVNEETGLLSKTGFVEVPSPVCIIF